MTVSPVIYNWPSSVIPINQLFYAGGETDEALYTVGGVAAMSPEPGGRAFLDVAFNYTKDDAASLDVSWLMSKVNNGNVFLIPIYRSIQVATPGTLTKTQERDGILWSNGQTWSNGQGWKSSPAAAVDAAALEGETTIVLDMGGLGSILKKGHVIGPSTGGAHIIDDISYVGTIATITLNPPLRRDVAEGSRFTLRPKMFCYMESTESFRAMFEGGRWVRPGSCTFIEALV